MALTRKFLKAIGIEEDKIEQIIEAHTDVTDALKEARDKYKDEAEKLPVTEKERDDAIKERDALQKKVDENESYKEKYEKEHQDFEDFKKSVDADKEKAAKVNAYKALLKKAGVSDKRHDAILKLTDVSDIKLNDKGEIEGADKIVESIKKDWSEFIVTESTKGADTEEPPENNGGGKKTKAEILSIKDRAERQKAISENLELFGQK
jgi:hypothetical protein